MEFYAALQHYKLHFADKVITSHVFYGIDEFVERLEVHQDKSDGTEIALNIIKSMLQLTPVNSRIHLTLSCRKIVRLIEGEERGECKGISKVVSDIQFLLNRNRTLKLNYVFHHSKDTLLAHLNDALSTEIVKEKLAHYPRNKGLSTPSGNAA